MVVMDLYSLTHDQQHKPLLTLCSSRSLFNTPERVEGSQSGEIWKGQAQSKSGLPRRGEEIQVRMS